MFFGRFWSFSGNTSCCWPRCFSSAKRLSQQLTLPSPSPATFTRRLLRVKRRVKQRSKGQLRCRNGDWRWWPHRKWRKRLGRKDILEFGSSFLLMLLLLLLVVMVVVVVFFWCFWCLSKPGLFVTLFCNWPEGLDLIWPSQKRENMQSIGIIAHSLWGM